MKLPHVHLERETPPCPRPATSRGFRRADARHAGAGRSDRAGMAVRGQARRLPDDSPDREREGAYLEPLGLNWTASFPSVAKSLRELGRSAAIDGEAVCQFEDGHSDFHALASDDGCAKAVLWAFDLLMIDGEDIPASPLEERR